MRVPSVPSVPSALTLLATALLVACGGTSGPMGPSGPPVITLVNGATLPSASAGATVVIAGSNFGSSQAVAAGHVVFSKGAGARDTATIASTADWTGTLIVTALPAGVPVGVDTLFVETSGGTSAPVLFTVVARVAFSPSTVTWTSTTALPIGLSGHAVAAATLPGTTPTSVVWVAGGAGLTSVPQDTVRYATVTSTGTLGTWTLTHPLPAPVAFAAAVVATPFNSPVTGASYLYVLGGDSTASGKPVATVYVGTLAAGGAVTQWSTATALPAPVHSLGAVIFNGNVYIAGGSGAGNVPAKTVYRAAIGSDGTLGAWQPLASLPFARSYFGFGVNGLFLYVFGGDSAAVTPNDSILSPSAINDVVYAQIDVHTGALTAAGWITSANKLKKVVTKHTAVVAGGNVLITGGLYNGASSGSTEETYAGLNPDGSTTAFNGATGTNTISSAGGGNLFNHAAVGYLDASGAFHVLVVGGDDVNTPTAKHVGAYYY
jgi:hypothetical protein